MICRQGERCKERIGWVKNGFALKMEDALKVVELPQKSRQKIDGSWVHFEKIGKGDGLVPRLRL